ncbi:MAG: hypothetical protein MK132_17805 [Lentisphaerales bacterium]|nr:hypothetical protein [Lentisphaerales bacterium]
MMGVAHRTLLFTVVLLGFAGKIFPEETFELHPEKENFDEALGSIAEGLLLFPDHKAEGMYLLNEAVRLDPHTPRIIDLWLEHAEARIISETDFSNNSISDFEKLRRYTIQCLMPIAQKHPDATYLHLKLVETCLELEHLQLAILLTKQLVAEVNDPYKIITYLKLYQLTNKKLFKELLKDITNNPALQNIFPLQYYALQCYISHNFENLADSALKHTLNMISNLPKWPEKQSVKLCQLLNDGLLTGSDIGRGAKDQLADSFYEVPALRYWASLAAILIKLEHYSHAHTILSHLVLKNAERKWRAYLSMATCAYHMGKHDLRLNYLKQASVLRPSSRSIKRAFAAACLNSKKYQKTAEILQSLKPFEDDIRLKKIEYYLNINLKNYPLAFKQAEALFKWPDPAERLKEVTPAFTSNSIPVYVQNKQMDLLLKRLQQSRKYHPQDHSLKNASAYFMAEHKLRLDFAEELSRQSLEFMPDNSSYLDTLAWIKYQKKQYPEAWKLIKKAVELDEKKSAEILMHAGDICLALGGLFSESKAKSFWREALQIVKDEKLKSELEKRLNSL